MSLRTYLASVYIDVMEKEEEEEEKRNSGRRVTTKP